MMLLPTAAAALSLSFLASPSSAFVSLLPLTHKRTQHRDQRLGDGGNIFMSTQSLFDDNDGSSVGTDTQIVPESHIISHPSTRRTFMSLVVVTSLLGSPLPILPAHAEGVAKSTADAVITDIIFIEFKGIPSAEGDIGSRGNDRITIGLFGNDTPQPVSILKQLVTKEGYRSRCKPLDTSRLLQKEQLEANKVYNTCLENEDSIGVNYDYSTVWRVVKDERIDAGAVSGRFVARESPTFEDAGSGLTHDAPGVVSVRRGDEGGYGFTIFPGRKGEAPPALDRDNVVVGRVVEGMDVVARMNGMPVVRSAGINYMALAGGPKSKDAPSRACRYGGSELYCNENKPLKKVLLDRTGLL